MNYTKKSFSVIAAGTDTYRENWERTFRPRCGAPFPSETEFASCELAKGHDDYHSYDTKLSPNGMRRWRDNGEILC